MSAKKKTQTRVLIAGRHTADVESRSFQRDAVLAQGTSLDLWCGIRQLPHGVQAIAIGHGKDACTAVKPLSLLPAGRRRRAGWTGKQTSTHVEQSRSSSRTNVQGKTIHSKPNSPILVSLWRRARTTHLPFTRGARAREMMGEIPKMTMRPRYCSGGCSGCGCGCGCGSSWRDPDVAPLVAGGEDRGETGRPLTSGQSKRRATLWMPSQAIKAEEMTVVPSEKLTLTTSDKGSHSNDTSFFPHMMAS